MNVCYIITSTIKCGPVNVLYGTVKDYKKVANFHPCIITLKSDDPRRSRRQDFIDLGIDVVQFDDHNLNKIIQFINDHHCQIIHSHGLRPDIINNKIIKEFPGKYVGVSTMHNYPFVDYVLGNGLIKGTLMAYLQMYVTRNLVRVACSKAIQAQFLKYKHLKLPVVENGVVFPDDQVIINNNHHNNQPTFLYIGDIHKRKRTAFLVNYFAQHPEYEFWLVGDGGDYYKEIQNMASTVLNVKVLGRTKTPEKYYQTADYFISASSAEGLPMAVLEALSYGMPVVLSDIAPHREVVNDNNGKLFKLDDMNSLNQAIKLLINTEYNPMVIYSDAKQRFSSEHMMKQYIALYQELLNKNN